MAKVSEETFIGRSPEDAWRLVGDVGHIDAWVSQIESCHLDGDHRTVRLADGSVLQERILERDESSRTYDYEVVESPFGFDSLTGRTEVHAHDGGCRVVWSADISPDELAPQIGALYAAALQGFKEMLEA